MRKVIPFFAFIILVVVCSDLSAQNQRQSAIKTKQPTNKSDKTPESKMILTIDKPASDKVSTNEIQIIEGRNVATDGQGVQSLATPQAIEAKKSTKERKD